MSLQGRIVRLCFTAVVLALTSHAAHAQERVSALCMGQFKARTMLPLPELIDSAAFELVASAYVKRTHRAAVILFEFDSLGNPAELRVGGGPGGRDADRLMAESRPLIRQQAAHGSLARVAIVRSAGPEPVLIAAPTNWYCTGDYGNLDSLASYYVAAINSLGGASRRVTPGHRSMLLLVFDASGAVRLAETYISTGDPRRDAALVLAARQIHLTPPRLATGPVPSIMLRSLVEGDGSN